MVTRILHAGSLLLFASLLWCSLSANLLLAQSLDEGADSLDASVACSDSSGNSCLVLQPTSETKSEDNGYAGEVAGALVGSVVSFYVLGVLSGGGSLLFLIPGALIGMGIGSKF